MNYEPPRVTRLGTINELTRVSEPYLRRSDNDPWVTDLNPGLGFLGGYTTAPLNSSITSG